MGGGLPDDLGEVARGFGKPGVRVVVLADLVVPSVHGARVGVAQRQVLSVRAVGMRQCARTIVVVRVVLRIRGQRVGPGERRCVNVQRSKLIVLVQNVYSEVSDRGLGLNGHQAA